MKRTVVVLLALTLTACLQAGTLDFDQNEVPVIQTQTPADAGDTEDGSNNGVDDNNGQTSTQDPDGGDQTTPDTDNIPECLEGQALCDGSCIDVTMDDANCGDCGAACDAGLICMDSSCVCEVGDFCGGACVDTTANQEHCGDCDSPCSGGQICEQGACVALGEVDGVVAATNQARAQGADCGTYGVFEPTTPLVADVDLHEAAQAHALDMAANNFFSHTGSDGSNFVERIQRTNFSGQPIGENIAAGQRSAAEVVAGWVESDGHCRNLMNPGATKIGVGYTTGGPYGTLWVQVFAR